MWKYVWNKVSVRGLALFTVPLSPFLSPKKTRVISHSQVMPSLDKNHIQWIWCVNFEDWGGKLEDFYPGKTLFLLGSEKEVQGEGGRERQRMGRIVSIEE